jgi:hypothetical protein
MMNFLKNNLKVTINYIKYNSLYKETKKLRKSKTTKKLFLFGNGNSIKLIDPYKILQLQKKGFEVMTTNSFLYSKIGKIIRPDYYVLSDHRLINPSQKFFDKTINKQITFSNSILKKLNTIIFLPSDFYGKHSFLNKIYYFNNLEINNKNFDNITIPRCYHSMTGLKAMSIACYLGYKEIYLCGFDNDQWTTIKVDQYNNIFNQRSHFYGNQKYYKFDHKIQIGSFLKKFAEIFENYELFKSYKIVNLDKNSLIDSFPKKHNLNVYKK